MPETSPSKKAAAIAMLVVGISLNSLGVVLRSLGGFRFVLLGAGLVLLLLALYRLVRMARTDSVERD